MLLTSCDRPYYGFELQGPDQFVMDSYKIREGKQAILEMQGKNLEELPENALQEYKDSIFEEDVLRIVLHHPTRPDIVSSVSSISNSVGYRVNQGRILIPDLPPIEVSGLSLPEASRKIEEQYMAQGQDVEVFLSYRERLIRRVDLIGRVEMPAIPVDGKIRLYDTLALAKIAENANLFMSYISRDGKLLSVDFNKLIKEGDMSQNLVMKGGDKIYIADEDESKIMIMGEVNFPRSIYMPSGSMSLREALVLAGGVPFTGDKTYIQVIRGDLKEPKVYQLNWNLIVNLPNKSLLLMPGDTIYVSAKPITDWNRFISQLLPSFGGIQTGLSTARSLGLQ